MELLSKIKNNLFAIDNTPKNDSLNHLSSDNRRQKETYRQWGIRICGIVSGSLYALPSYLHNVYNSISREQANNANLQEQAKINIQSEIKQKNDQIGYLGKQIQEAEASIDGIKQKITELKEQQQKIESSKERVNKNQKIKLIIGLGCVN